MISPLRGTSCETPFLHTLVMGTHDSYLDFFLGEPGASERLIDLISSNTGENRDVYLYEYLHCRPVTTGLIPSRKPDQP